MFVTTLIIAFLFGIEIAFIQIKFHERSLKTRTFSALGLTVILSITIGYLFYHFGLINSLFFYLMLIIAGVSVGFFILLERLVLKYWWMVIVTGIVTGVVSLILMRKNSSIAAFESFTAGIMLSLGYLIYGNFKRIWQRTDD
ncbi:MAG: hypothetical protein ISS81_01085 [Candidatus Marinimicrobia bacterium]|nr:hypothetical protein [Candidatus Neomarinimicrobiota bacterium]